MCDVRIGEAKELHCFKRSDAIICAAVGAKNTQASEEFLLMMQYPLVLFVFKQKKNVRFHILSLLPLLEVDDSMM